MRRNTVTEVGLVCRCRAVAGWRRAVALLLTVACLAVGWVPVGTAPASAVQPGPEDGQIAFSAKIPDGCPTCIEIFTMAPNGSGVRQLTHTGGAGPDWSPNGHRLLFQQVLRWEVYPIFGIWMMTSESRKPTRVLRRGYSPAWAPRGRRFAFTRVVDGSSQLHLYTFRTGRIRALTDRTAWANVHAPTWSPNGRRIAFVGSPASRPHALADLYTMRLDGTGVRRLTRTPQHYEAAPDWSPRGGRIVFERSDGDLSCTSVLVIRRTGQEERRLRRCSSWSPAWSPDARWVTASGVNGIEVFRADGTQRRNLGVSGGGPSWGVEPAR